MLQLARRTTARLTRGDGGTRPDAERDGCHRHRRKSRTTPQNSRGMPDLAPAICHRSIMGTNRAARRSSYLCMLRAEARRVLSGMWGML
jgi:hypothetical protein